MKKKEDDEEDDGGRVLEGKNVVCVFSFSSPPSSRCAHVSNFLPFFLGRKKLFSSHLSDAESLQAHVLYCTVQFRPGARTSSPPLSLSLFSGCRHSSGELTRLRIHTHARTAENGEEGSAAVLK